MNRTTVNIAPLIRSCSRRGDEVVVCPAVGGPPPHVGGYGMTLPWLRPEISCRKGRYVWFNPLV